MALTKADEKRVKDWARECIDEVVDKDKINYDKYKQTEKRLRAYPILKRNIEEYKLDIKDIESEDMQKSKDIILYSTAGGEKPDIEEVRAVRILAVKKEMIRDEKEIRRVECALREIENDRYYKIIDMIYFKNMTREEIARELNIDEKTVSRNRTALIKKAALKLYGADAL